MKKFSHTFDLCATVESDNPDSEQISQDEIKLAFLSRLVRITKEEGTEPFGVVDVISNDDEEEEGVVGLFTTHPTQTRLRGFPLNYEGAEALEIITKFMSFYGIERNYKCISKAEWISLNLPYCHDAALIVEYTTGTKAHEVFSLDGHNYPLNDKFQAALKEQGMWFEEGTQTYGGVYHD